MILKETLKKVVQAQRAELEKRDMGVIRDLLPEIDLNLPHAIILSGIRRCGKSTLLRQLMRKAEKNYYFNFEDSRVSGFDAADFERLEQVFKDEYGDCQYYFFDEIQVVGGWEIFVRNLLDRGKKCIITGSNASLLSKELGTKLTGRHLTYELFPFSYNEMLKLTSRKESKSSFDDYFNDGGFPEFLKYKKNELLQQLFKDILNRDIIVRHKIREAKIVEEIALFLLTNSGKEFSYNNLAKYFKLGSPNSIISYVSFFEDSYLIFTIPKFDYSLKKQIINPKKIYGIDVGFSKANSASFSEDKGRMLENLVFLHLRRKFKNIYYFKENNECDFLIKEKEKITAAIQVCFELNDENKDREVEGLKEAMRKFKLKKGKIVTLDQEDKIGNISIVPIWKYVGDKS
ncbi:MAG: ATP-binding protein [Nanoarchaeota archaeon]|nr:ATP-binding protein [Nanoarchaeota archaeon]